MLDSFLRTSIAVLESFILFMIFKADFSYVFLFFTNITTPNAPTPRRPFNENKDEKSDVNIELLL